MKRLSSILPYAFSAALLVLSVHGVHAQILPVTGGDAPASANDYTPLAPLPGLSSVPTSGEGSFANYINAVYRVALLISGLLAVIMITWGGIEYMGGDSVFNKEEGRKKIQNAIVGLLLLVSSFLILNTINPKLVDLNFDICPPNTARSADGTCGASSGSAAPASPANTGTQTVTPTTGGTTGGDPTMNIYSPSANVDFSSLNVGSPSGYANNSGGLQYDTTGQSNGDGKLPQY